jgi:vanillate O-demethylase ferredoxin subunit
LHLARSGKTVNVAANVSLLQSLRDHGVDVPSSCEQGVCGTCRTRVLDGTPLHCDAYLTPQERAAGDCMMLCVSRAVTDTLTLDL